MNEEELAERFEDATWHIEHQNHDLNFVGKFALSEVPREHGFNVVLTGEGADEHLGGYPMFLPDFLREPDPAWPQTTLSDDERRKRFASAEESVAKYYETIGADASNRGESVASRQLNHISTCASMAAFSFTLWAPWTRYYGTCDPRLTIANNANGRVRDAITCRWHPLHAAQYMWTKGHLTNNFLSCLGDRTEMAHSTEARTPFLDHHLTDYVNHLPPSVKIRWDPRERQFIEKWILLEASKPFITQELYERKKHPYSAPTTWPEGGPLHKLMDGLVTKENVEELRVRGLGRGSRAGREGLCRQECTGAQVHADCGRVGRHWKEVWGQEGRAASRHLKDDSSNTSTRTFETHRPVRESRIVCR